LCTCILRCETVKRARMGDSKKSMHKLTFAGRSAGSTHRHAVGKAGQGAGLHAPLPAARAPGDCAHRWTAFASTAPCAAGLVQPHMRPLRRQRPLQRADLTTEEGERAVRGRLCGAACVAQLRLNPIPARRAGTSGRYETHTTARVRPHRPRKVVRSRQGTARWNTHMARLEGTPPVFGARKGVKGV